MLVEHAAIVRIWPTSGRFRRVIKPAYWHTDFPWMAGAANWRGQENMVVSAELQAVLPKPVRVPCNSRLIAGASTSYDAEYGAAVSAGGVDTDLPLLSWSQQIGVGTLAYTPVWGGTTQRSLGLSVSPTTYGGGDSNAVQLQTTTVCHAALLRMTWRPQPAAVLAAGAIGGTSAKTEPSDAWVGVVVGSGADRSYWRVRSTSNQDLVIETLLQDDSDWSTKETIPVPISDSPLADMWSTGQSEPTITAEFRLIGGRMQVRVLEQTWTFAEDRIDGTGAAITTITAMQCGASRFSAVTVWAEPIRWSRTMRYDSPEATIGFASEAFAGHNVDEVPGSASGWTTTLDEENSSLLGPIVWYRLDVTGPNDGSYLEQDYSNLCYGIRAVNLEWTAQEVYDPTVAEEIEFERVVVTHRYDPTRLTVVSDAQITCNNNSGSWGEWSRDHGQVAVEIYAARTTPLGTVASELIFTGYGHVRGDVLAYGGGSSFVMHCRGRCVQLEHDRFNLPWMDGWNMFYALGYLAQLGGVSKLDLGFAPQVPVEPFGEGTDLGDGSGNPAYYLPVGPGGSVISRSRAEPLLDRMLRISSGVGYLLFFDVAGDLVCRKFALPSGVKRSFFESDRESLGQPGGGFEGARFASATKDLSEVKNQASVIGIDAFASKWDAIIETREDSASIEDPLAANHLGYPAPAVWMDSQFAEPGFAADAADETIRVLSQPGQVEQIVTWIQPDIFPLDIVQLQSDRLGTRDTRMMVVEVRHELSQQAASSVIGARLVPE